MSSEPETGPSTGGVGPGRALVRIVPAKPRIGFVPGRQHAVWAAGMLLAIGAAGAGLEAVRSFAPAGDRPVVADATTQLLHRLQDDVGHLKGSVDTLRTSADAKQDESIRSLKKSVENLRQEIEQTRSSDGATLAQLSTKIDKTDHDPSQKLAEIMARLDRLDPKDKSGDPAAGQKLADVANRLERIERQVGSPATTGSIPPAKPATPLPPVAPRQAAAAAAPIPLAAAALPAPKPVVKAETDQKTTEPKVVAPKSATVDGWVVRDVYDGMALVEGRGGLREIAPGEFLPGAGEVHAIQRRGKSWVVLTDRGVIGNSTW